MTENLNNSTTGANSSVAPAAVPYIVTTKKQAETGDTRAITIKGNKEKGIEGKYTLVPRKSDNWVSMLPVEVMRELFEQAENKYIIEVVKTKGTIAQEARGLDAFIAWFKSSESARISKESIALWFASHVKEVLHDTLTGKGFAAAKADQLCEVYLGHFQKLAARLDEKGKLYMKDAIKDQLLKVFALLGEDAETGIGYKVAERLAACSEEEDVGVEDVL